ncbi:MAG: DinB family protein [Chloroflexi bacterium]|nr:DinB family protein [Chloroflexota bacterium]
MGFDRLPDPILTSARAVLRGACADIHAAIDGLPTDALNWRPAPEDTNSIAVLAIHSLTSTRHWLCVAVDEPLPSRDRDAEFEATARKPAELLHFVDSATAVCLSLIDKDRVVDWSALRSHWDDKLFAAWALLHALEHLREHVGQISLTRQLWEQRPRSP